MTKELIERLGSQIVNATDKKQLEFCREKFALLREVECLTETQISTPTPCKKLGAAENPDIDGKYGQLTEAEAIKIRNLMAKLDLVNSEASILKSFTCTVNQVVDLFDVSKSTVVNKCDRGAKSMLVYAPKTDLERSVPIFPPLDGILLEAYHRAPEGSVYVIENEGRRLNESNNRSALNRSIRKAGKPPWQKLFQNLRPSCETDWIAAGIPLPTVARWMGHSVRVMLEYYDTITQFEMEAAQQRNPFVSIKESSGKSKKPRAKK